MISPNFTKNKDFIVESIYHIIISSEKKITIHPDEINGCGHPVKKICKGNNKLRYLLTENGKLFRCSGKFFTGWIGGIACNMFTNPVVTKIHDDFNFTDIKVSHNIICH